jgi:hypothetical protein
MTIVMAGNSKLKYGTYYSVQPNGGPSKVVRILILGIIVMAGLGGILFFLSTLGGSYKNDVTLLAARENSLLQLANTSQKSIRSDTLATANSNAAILLASDASSIVTSTGIKKLPENLVKQEADTNADKLKQALLLDKFDITYRKVVLDKVANLITQAKLVRTAAPSDSNRKQLDGIITNLESINKQFTDITLE